MSVDRVAARVHAREAADAPDPLLERDLARLDAVEVGLPPGPATAEQRATAALALAAGIPPAEAARMTEAEVAALAAAAPSGE